VLGSGAHLSALLPARGLRTLLAEQVGGAWMTCAATAVPTSSGPRCARTTIRILRVIHRALQAILKAADLREHDECRRPRPSPAVLERRRA
jgi:hypothetical protein